MKNFSTILFVIYQATLIILDAAKVIDFNFAYSMVSLFLICLSGYEVYIKSQEIPRLTKALEERLSARDREIAEIKSEISKHTVARSQGNVSGFRF